MFLKSNEYTHHYYHHIDKLFFKVYFYYHCVNTIFISAKRITTIKIENFLFFQLERKKKRHIGAHLNFYLFSLNYLQKLLKARKCASVGLFFCMDRVEERRSARSWWMKHIYENKWFFIIFYCFIFINRLYLK